MNKEAFALGAEIGYFNTIMPSDAEFVKSAAKVGVDAGALKKLYIDKVAAIPAIPWAPLLAGGALGLGASGLMGGGLNALGAALKPNIRNQVNIDPWEQQLQDQAKYNAEAQRRMWAIRNANAPMQNPMAGMA
jgi:hypothetical protein